MQAPLTLIAHLENGVILERTYHVGGIARMMNNLERVAREDHDSPILRVEIAPATEEESARSLERQMARIR